MKPCPECGVEIRLGEYLREALDTNQRLEAALDAYSAQREENERLARELRLAQMHISAQGLELARAEREANPFHGMYQDAEGTIPVTAAGQPVGLIKESEMSEVKNVQPAP